jgi:rubrerythrin
MSQTLTISDELYQGLAAVARQRGLATIEQLLASWQAAEDEMHKRQQVVQQIDAVRERLFQRYGEMPDSVDVLRDDRAR